MLEKFNKEMQKISANLCDPNTSKTTKRTLTIKLEIKPDKNSEIGDVEILVSSTIAPTKSVPTKLVFGYDQYQKKGVVSELNTDMLGQLDLEELEEELKEKQANKVDNVVDLQKTQNN